MVRTWQKRRGDINHNWLKNRYLPALKSWLNLLDDKIINPELENNFLITKFPQWQLHSKEVSNLAKDFESQMSPKILFDTPPLSNCDEDTKQWLGDLVHKLWLARYPVKTWIRDVLYWGDKTDDLYQELQKKLNEIQGDKTLDKLRPLRTDFEEFINNCQSLATAIEKFPSEVKVI